jgi:2-phosphoglycerate kinase
MRQPSVILIGGPPMIGKTTLARRLAARLDYGMMSTDDVGQSIRAVTTPDSHPGLHSMSGMDYREYYISRSTERLIQDAESQHQAMWPALEAIIKSHTDWAGPIVVEGWALMPEAVAELNIPGVESLVGGSR